MKRCPTCNQYFDDENDYCLEDGTRLVGGLSTADMPTQVITRPGPVVVSGGPSNMLYLVIGVLATALVGLAVYMFFLRDAGKPPGGAANNATPQATGTATPAPSPSAPANSVTSERAAEANRYIKDNCGSVLDKQTGLEWYVGADRNVTWFESRDWTSALNACGGQWRMPSVNEIAGLYDRSKQAGSGYFTKGRYFPAHIDPVFGEIGGGAWVWAGDQPRDEKAVAFNLNQGKAVEISALNTMYSTRAFAIRSRD